MREHGLKKWTNERCTTIQAWVDDNNTTLTQAAKHFKYSYGAMAQGMLKWRKSKKNQRAALKQRIIRRSRSVNLPAVTADQVVEAQAAQRSPLVPVIMVPMNQLTGFLAASYAANK